MTCPWRLTVPVNISAWVFSVRSEKHIAFYEFSMKHRIKIQISGEHDFYGSYTRKCTLVQALRLCTGHMAHRGRGSIALLFLDHGTRRGWGVNVTPRPLFISGKNPVPIVQEAGWAPGPVWTGTENLAFTGIRSPDRPTRSQSLYRISYPGHNYTRKPSKIWRGLWTASVTSVPLQREHEFHAAFLLEDLCLFKLDTFSIAFRKIANRDYELRHVCLCFCLSVHPSVWNSAPIGRISCNFIFGYFSKICCEN